MRPRALIAAALVAAAAVAVLAWPSGTHRSPPGGSGFAAVVVRPVDGDTLVARAGGRTFYVRLLGLESDPTQDRVDRYGRMLAYVWLADGRLLETAQLESGWATTYVYAGHPVSLFPRLAAAARQARVTRRGVWSACGGDFHSAAG
jgi:endonuclease YncB( thermonuclease family)